MDPSTQKLLERTKQRREQLNLELSLANMPVTPKPVPNKRKSTSEPDSNCENSRETPFKKSSFNENDNLPSSTTATNNDTASQTSRRSFYPLEELEQLAKQVVTEDESKTTIFTYKSVEQRNEFSFASSDHNSASPIKTDSGIQGDPKKLQDFPVTEQARKARVAALAAKIGSWEDDTSHHSSSLETGGQRRPNENANLKSAQQQQQKPSIDKNSPLSNEKISDCGVESFFIRKNSTTEVSPGKIEEPKHQPTIPPAPTVVKPTSAVDRPKPVLKRDLAEGQASGKVFAMANKWENEMMKHESKSTTNVDKTPATTASATSKPMMKPVLPCPPANEFKATKNKIASNLQYVNVRPPAVGSPTKRDVQKDQVTTGENRDVGKLKNRWEIASQRGIALQPEQSLSQYDILQAAAKLAQPRGRCSPMVAKNQDTAKKPATEGTYSSHIEVRVLPKVLPNIVSTTNIVLEKPIIEVKNDDNDDDDKPVGVMSADSSYDGGSSDNSEFVDSAELDACLTEAINSATLHAAQKTPTHSRIEENPDEPLLYTVSMYRKMQKDISREPTPLKAVIKPPSSPRRNATEVVQNVEKNPGVYESRVKYLNDAITVQQEQIYQASRALNYCRNNEEFRGSTEEVNAHKVLLVAGERRKALQQELDRVHECRKQRKPLDSKDPLGTLIFQYISLSLKREFVNDRINSMGDYVYYFICTLKYRDQLITTQVVDSDVAVRAGGRMEFPNYFQFNSLPHDFNIEVSVFSLQTKREELSHEQKYRLNGQTLKHKQRPNSALLTSTTSLGGPGGVMDTNFRLVGQINLTLSSVNRQKFALQGYQFVAPLEPVIHLKVRCCADSVGTVEEKGFLSVYEEITDLGSWHRRWCTLKDGVLRFWRYPDEETTKDPVSSIDLIDCVTKTVGPVVKEVCTRPNTFVLDLRGETTAIVSHLLSADNKEECLGWCEKLNQALHNLRLWNVESS